MEQRPPLPWDIEALHEALGFAANDIGLRGLRRQRFRCVTLDRRGVRLPEVWSDRATGGDHEAGEGENGSRAVSDRSGHLCYFMGWGSGSAGEISSAGCRRRENRSIRTGRMIRMRTGASRMPPTTTRASGFWTYEPMPVEMAAGNRPTQAATQVIMTGRSRI